MAFLLLHAPSMVGSDCRVISALTGRGDRYGSECLTVAKASTRAVSDRQHGDETYARPVRKVSCQTFEHLALHGIAWAIASEIKHGAQKQVELAGWSAAHAASRRAGRRP